MNMEGNHHEHQSLALLAGVAVDKGPETKGQVHYHHGQGFQPMGAIPSTPSVHNNCVTLPTSTNGPVSVVKYENPPVVVNSHQQYSILSANDANIIEFPINHNGTTVQLPIQIEMANGDMLSNGNEHRTNMVEVQYVMGPSGEFQVATTTGGTNNMQQHHHHHHGSKIVIETIENAGEVEMQHSQPSYVISASHSDMEGHHHVTVEQAPHNNIAQEEVITSLVDEEMVNMEINEIISSESSSMEKIEESDYLEQDNNSNSMSSETRSEDQFTEASNNNSGSKKICFLCQVSGRNIEWIDLFGTESKKMLLPQLINRYMSISIIPKYNSKNDYPICGDCVKMLLRWHDVSFKYNEKKNNQSASSSIAEASEDDNSQDDQMMSSNNGESKKPRGKYQKRIGTRKYRYALLQSQIKNKMFDSPYHYMIKREFSEEDWEYIAERLHSTKSNSSAKVKQIEKLIFQNEKLVSIFCDDCRKSISGGKEGYYEHRKTFHSDSDDFTLPCDICGNFYPEKDSTGLSRNYFPHWINHFYFEECQDCKEKFPNPSLLKKHVVVHQQRPGFPCPKCDKVLAKKITLEQHIKTHLPEAEKKKHALTCHICGKIITAPTLKAHMFSVHSDERPWKCEVCGARFKHKSDLSGHRNAVHLKIKNFNCSVCGKSFGHHCGLRVHMMKHENKREHACPTCGKKFITQWHLKKHIVTHKEEKDVICETCGKGFKKLEALQEHMTIHTGEMPHECHICGRRVRVLSNLYKHYMVHKKNKTYYSKKDGLPDPMDAYILEQQKKKQVNKIVEENAASRPQPMEEVNSAASNGFEQRDEDREKVAFDFRSENNTPFKTGMGEPELKVNRSANRITYRGPSGITTATAGTITPTLVPVNSLVKVEPGVNSIVLNSDNLTSNNVVESRIPDNQNGLPVQLPVVSSHQQVYVTNSDSNFTVPLQLSNGNFMSVVQPSQILCRIVDENGVEMETIPVSNNSSNMPQLVAVVTEEMPTRTHQNHS